MSTAAVDPKPIERSTICVWKTPECTRRRIIAGNPVLVNASFAATNAAERLKTRGLRLSSTVARSAAAVAAGRLPTIAGCLLRVSSRDPFGGSFHPVARLPQERLLPCRRDFADPYSRCLF